MKNHFLFIILLLAISCNDSNTTPPKPSCQLTKISDTYSSNLFEYNANNAITGRTYLYQTGSTEAAKRKFEYSSNKVSVSSTGYGSIDNLGPFVKDYEISLTNSLPAEMKNYYSNGSNFVEQRFVYTGSKLSYYINLEKDVQTYKDSIVVTFDNSGLNIIEETSYDYNNTSKVWEENGTTKYQYDGNHNPYFKQIWDSYIDPSSYFRNNNIVSANYKEFGNSYQDTNSYSYAYNANQFPVSKVDLSKPSESDYFEYNCQ